MDAFVFSVNVHVFVLSPLLEQAPDQIASRAFETLNVIDVPVANDADPGRHAPRIPRDGKTDQPGRAIAVFTIGKPSTCDGAPARLGVLEQSAYETLPLAYVDRRILRRS